MAYQSANRDILNIKPPFGYGEIIPLLKSHHILPPDPSVPAGIRGSNAMPITMAEIPRAGRDFPVVFVSADGGRSFGVVALLGLKDGENLFIAGDGRWRSDAYQPAYLRRYPFCMATVTADGKQQEERIVCVERAMLDEARGRPQEDASGEPLLWWRDQLHMIHEYEADILRTQQMCSTLQKFRLLVPFSTQAVTNGGQVMNLGGMFRVDESRLLNLRADDLRMLIRKGVMGRLYTHMVSLDNLARLLDLNHQR